MRRSIYFIGIVALYLTESSTATTCSIRNDRYESSKDQRAAALSAVTRGALTFSGNLLTTLAATRSGNQVCSPLSAYLVLSMAAYGARGKTEQQLRSVLAFPQNEIDAKIGFQAHVDSLANFRGVELHIANKIFLAKGFQPSCDFTRVTTRAFRSREESVDFRDSEGASRTINRWCAHQTKNRITEIIKPREVNRFTALVLVNAVYFKGQWLRKFNVRHTRPRPFHIDSRRERMIPTMRASRRIRHGSIPEARAKFVQLPYKSSRRAERISMFVILPDDKNGMKHLEENLGKVNLYELIRRAENKFLHLELPKFKIESTIPLVEPLKTMGLTDMFTDDADFTGITTFPPLKVSSIIQKAMIEINEEGSEAAATTAGIFGPTAVMNEPRPLEFKANHPFKVIIATTGSNPVKLFSARFTGR